MTSQIAARREAGGTRKYAFILPLLLVLAASGIVPTVYALIVSLYDWNWGTQFQFAGLDNYVKVLGDGLFWSSLFRTAVFSLLAVGTELVLGLVLALAVNSVTRGVGWLRTVFIVPLMVSGIVVSFAWKIMLDPTLGVIPRLLDAVGLHAVDLLGNPASALPAIAGMDTWWQTGFVFIILSAALAALPQEPLEAAEVDGASIWQRFSFVTLPLLRPILIVVAGIRLVDCLKVFALVFGTTDGGPNRATEMSQTLAYKTGFTNFAISESMTMMIVYSLIIVAVVVIVAVIRKAATNAK